MGWAAPYKDILENAYPSWKQSGNDARRTALVYPELITAIRKHHKEVLLARGSLTPAILPKLDKELQDKIKTWMNNHTRGDVKESSEAPPDMRTAQPSERQAITSLFVNEIQQEIKVQCDTDPDPKAKLVEWNLTKGGNGYLKYFQRAVTAVGKDLTPEQKQLVQETVETWKHDGLPAEIQKK